MAEELVFKLGIDISAVESAATKIPEEIERNVRKQGRSPAANRGSWKPGPSGQPVWTWNPPAPPAQPPTGSAPTPTPTAPVPPVAPTAPVPPVVPPVPPGAPGTTQPPVPPQSANTRAWSAYEKLSGTLKVLERVEDFMDKAGEKAMRIQANSRATGLSGELLQGLEYAAKQSNVNQADVIKALETGKAKLGSATLKGGDTAAMLQRIGLSLQNVRSGATGSYDVLLRLADMYENQGNSAQLAAAGTAIFGSEFTKLIPMLAKGRTGIQDMIESAPKMSDSTLKAIELKNKQVGTFTERAVNTAGWFDSLTTRFATNLQEESAIVNSVSAITDEDVGARPQEVLKALTQKKGEETDIGGYKIMGQRYEGESRKQAYERIGAEDSYNANMFYQLKTRVKPEHIAYLDKLSEGTEKKEKAAAGMQSLSLPIAGSLQQIGGGDLYSSLNRGPIDGILQATERTATATEQLATRTQVSTPTNQTTLE